MRLSTEVKGYIEDVVPTKIYSWAKITTFGRRIGIDTTNLDTSHGKRAVVQNFMDKVGADSAELVISTLIDMSKRGMWDHNYSEEVVADINPILERTMNCRVDNEGKLSMLFPLLKQQPDQVASKLQALGCFKDALSNYEQASKTYLTSPKGSIALLRSTVESLVNETLVSRGITPHTSFKDKLNQLATLGIVKPVASPECPQCHAKKTDCEMNFSYDFYGLLSHYGSHGSAIDDAMANFLFTSVSAFVWLVLNRYESLFAP